MPNACEDLLSLEPYHVFYASAKGSIAELHGPGESSWSSVIVLMHAHAATHICMLLLLLLFSLQYRKFRVVDESEKVNKD